MGRHWKEPMKPGFTCPDIDKLQKELESIDTALDEAQDKIVEAMTTAEDVSNALENLRSENAQLREWGEWWEEEAEERQLQIAALEDEVEDLKIQLREAVTA